MAPAQRSFEDLGTPLSEVVFCVLDIETTGGSPRDSAITEIGACKVRRGEVVGTFQTLVDPGEPVPAFIRLLTGIDDELLAGAPRVETVLPSLLEFLRDSVLVAHNARFDVSFINAALAGADYPVLGHPLVDTAALARRILSGEVPNSRLETLARHLRCAHKPCHRAYADVLATIDVLHHLIERVAGFGVTTLEDLLAISSSRMDGTFSKIALTAGIPKAMGTYRFIGATGQTLYVGKAADLRARVRSYFYGDPRARIRDLLRETQSIETESHPTMLEAEIAEARSIARDRPPYNRRGKRAGTWYVKVSPNQKTARVAAARTKPADGSLYVGPFSSLRTVRALIDAIRDAASIHRCSRPERCGGCAFSEMGRCVGRSPDDHRAEVALVARAVETDPSIVLERLAGRMKRLAAQERFEEAAEVRDRGAALGRALRRRLEEASLREAGEILIGVGNRAVLVREGRAIAGMTFAAGAERVAVAKLLALQADPALPGGYSDGRTIIAWLRSTSEEVRVLHAGSGWSMPVGARPSRLFTVVPAS